MKTRLYVILISLLFISHIQSQNVGINSTGATPNSSAQLDLNTGNTFTSPNGKGLFVPNVSLTTTADVTTVPVGASQQSLLVYNSNNAITGTGASGKGYYWWDNTSALWINLVDNLLPGAPWLTNGNAGTTASSAAIGSTVNNNFIGTTDAQNFVIATNNLERMRVLSGGNIGIGTLAPAVPFAVNGNGTNVYATDAWIENNLHVQGNEVLTQGGRGRLRVGTAWNYSGLYSEASSTGVATDLVLGSSNALVRIGPAAGGQKLRVSALESTGNRMVMADLNGTLFLGTGANQGYGANIQSVSLATCQTTSSSSWVAVPGMSITFTPVHSTVYIFVSCSGRYSNASGSSSVAGSGFNYLRVYNVSTAAQAAITQGILGVYDGTGATVTAGYTGMVAIPVSVTAGSSVTLRLDWFLGRVSGAGYLGICPGTNIGDHLVFTILD